MSDIVATTERMKEGGRSSSIKYPMLTATNYTMWAMRMKITLRVHKAWEAIETEMIDNKKNDMALAFIVPVDPGEFYSASRRT